MVGAAGLEPATLGLEDRCSIQLSYAPVLSMVATAGRQDSGVRFCHTNRGNALRECGAERETDPARLDSLIVLPYDFLKSRGFFSRKKPSRLANKVLRLCFGGDMGRPLNSPNLARGPARTPSWVLALTAFTIFLCLAVFPAAAQNAQLRVVVVDGTQATNNIENGRMADVVVQVQDASRMPVSGASVSFVYPPSGASGVFANGQRTLTVTTGQDGRAAVSGVSPEGGPGQLQIRIAASYQGQTATAVVNQTNISVPVPQSASPSDSSSATQSSASQGQQRSGASRKKKIWIAVVIAAGVAAGSIAAASGGGSSGSTSQAPTIVLTPGTPTVGGP